MAVIDLEVLLKPVSAEAPCGPNLEYEPPFLTLQELARGKPEQVVGDRVKPAQDPAWPNVRQSAEQLLGSTKDLRVAGILHLSLVKTTGIAGLDAGLCLIRRMLEQHWEHLHPQLDAEEGNDPTFRVNSLLAALVSEEALATVRAAPLVESRQFGKHSLRHHRIATGVLTPGDGQTGDAQQELARIDAAFADAPIEALSQTAALVGSAADHLNGIQHVLLDKADGIPEDLKALSADLRDMRSLFEAQLAKRGVTSGIQAEGEMASGAVGDEARQGPSGTLRNRSDVITTIDRICEYYARAEPSSPVPLLLQRAKRLVNMDFMGIVRDLTPSGVTEAETIGGIDKRNA
ncbi:MAG TPA: type VI secretion system protein TssA [Steroidobacteraceae bacterium]|nr:type VI secretion system protein TssA [Steroidobacteraceae bacterium]